MLSKLPEAFATTTTTTTTTAKNKTTNRKTAATTAYLIGNTKHLWPIFLRWLHKENRTKHQELVHGDNGIDNDHTDGERILIEDPLDTYEQSAILDVVERVCACPPKDGSKLEDSSSSSSDTNRMLYWSSDLDPARMVSMARIASCTGFSYLDPHTHLSVHPTFGTWHSYRAVLLLPEEFESSVLPPPPPTVLPNPLSPLDRRAAQDAFDTALDTSMKNRNKSKTKMTALATSGKTRGETATSATTTTTSREEPSGIGKEARSELSEELGRGNYKNDGQEANSNLRKLKVATAWIFLRDAISIGRETYRFDENQLWYHYTKDSRYLSNGIQNISLENGS